MSRKKAILTKKTFECGCFSLFVNEKELKCPSCQQKVAFYVKKAKNITCEYAPFGVSGELDWVVDYHQYRITYTCGAVFKLNIACDKTIWSPSTFETPCPTHPQRVQDYYNAMRTGLIGV